MKKTTFQGQPVQLAGTFVETGTQAPDFTLVKTDLSAFSLEDVRGSYAVLNIFPSLDTAVCAASVRHFNQSASQLQNTKVLCISKDLPFAHARFCTTEGLNNVIALSDFRAPEFGIDYGVLMKDGVLAGLLARAVVILDPSGKVIYTELVSEITHEPDYTAALAILGK
ncbi:MAG: thiol peroxidase [Prevotellaceae bacterium]|jgi:thiol peroxidase|nr:thiol peroxidase [Prevotellaceae bacterium]